MSYPRADYPASAVQYYQEHGALATCRAYRAQWTTMRRWLVARGVPIRPQGLRLGRMLVHGRQLDDRGAP
jgi:hypothetical protein